MIGFASQFHQRFVRGRRIGTLVGHLAELLPTDARVLDIGCGDGRLSAALMVQRPDLRIRGVEVVLRPETHIEVQPFDGQWLPFSNRAFDSAILIDVLHHTENPADLLAEAARVSDRQVIVKDHLREGFAAQATLAMMDRVGNAGLEMSMPGNYLSAGQWRSLFDELKLDVVEWRTRLGLYAFPLSICFDRSLHFMASLKVSPSLSVSPSSAPRRSVDSPEP